MALTQRPRHGFFFSTLKCLCSLQRFNHIVSDGGLQNQLFAELASDERILVDASKWKKINSKFHGLMRSNIPSHAFQVIRILQRKGYDAYLVGGCVRDLLLNRAPKDFDIITTAKLDQIKKQFHRCMIIGRRFPICKVHINGADVEVSSFETVAEHSEDKEAILLSLVPAGCGEKDIIRWRNSMHRDFTVNSLFYDPFMNKIYDYANGIADLRSLKLRTIIPAHLSFQEDCARILRGLRIAGRLGLSISKETEIAMKSLSSSVKSLDKFRKMMELNYMLSYGAAATTISLLRRFNLLEIFLPFHAAYLDQQTKEQCQNTLMLMKLFFHLDRLVGCGRPCHSSVWIGLLSFHQALIINPQDPLVVWTFASVLYFGKWKHAVKFAKGNANLLVRFLPEILESTNILSDDELSAAVSQLGLLVQESLGAFVDEDLLLKYMAIFPVSPSSDLVFVPAKTASNVAQIFHVLIKGVEHYRSNRRNPTAIDYSALGRGHLKEIRFVLGKVLMDTLSGGGFEKLNVFKQVVEYSEDEEEKVEEEEEMEDEAEVECEALSDLIKHKVVNEEKTQKQTLKNVSQMELLTEKRDVVLTKVFQHVDKRPRIMAQMLLEEEVEVMPANTTSEKFTPVNDAKKQRTRKQDSLASEYDLHDMEALQLHVCQNCSTSNMEKTKQMERKDGYMSSAEVMKEKKDCPITLEEVVKKEIHPPSVEKENQRPSLSSLFRR